MAQLEDMRLPAGAREALVDDPNFLRELVEAALNRFLDAEISEHLQAGPYERSEGRAGYRNGYRPRQLKTRVGTLTLAVARQAASAEAAPGVQSALPAVAG